MADANIPRLSRRDALRLGVYGGAALASALYFPPSVAPERFARLVPNIERERFRHGPFSHGVRTSWLSSNSFRFTTRMCPRTEIEATHGMFRLYNDEDSSLIREIEIKARSLNDYWTGETITGLDTSIRYRYELFYEGSRKQYVGYTHSPLVRALDRDGTERDFERYAFISCMNYGEGFWDMLEYLRRLNPDMCFFIGDLSYEYQSGASAVRADIMPDANEYQRMLMRHWVYNDHYKRMLLSMIPGIYLPDDHEFKNDVQGFNDVRVFQAGTRAFSTTYPCLEDATTQGYQRTVTTPRGTRFIVLDTRSHRDLAGGTMLGAEQKAWFFEQLRQAKIDNVKNLFIITSVPLVTALESREDAWGGFPEERQEFVDELARWDFANESRPKEEHANVFIVSGDIHKWATAGVHVNPIDPNSPRLATEFVVGALSSKQDTQGRFSEVTQAYGKDANSVLTTDVHPSGEVLHSFWTYDARRLNYYPVNGARFLCSEHKGKPQMTAQSLDPNWVADDGGLLLLR